MSNETMETVAHDHDWDYWTEDYDVPAPWVPPRPKHFRKCRSCLIEQEITEADEDDLTWLD